MLLPKMNKETCICIVLVIEIVAILSSIRGCLMSETEIGLKPEGSRSFPYYLVRVMKKRDLIPKV